MTAQLFLFDTAALIDGLQLAFELSAATGETVGIEDESYTPAQVDAAIAALDALPEKQEEVYTGAQVGAAIAKLRMLPKKPHTMTATELRAECKRLGLKGYSKMTKPQMQAAIATETRITQALGEVARVQSLMSA